MSVLGVIAIRVLQEAELRIHFLVEITIWTVGQRLKLAFYFVDNVLPVGILIRDSKLRCQCLQSAFQHQHKVMDAPIFLPKGITASSLLNVSRTGWKNGVYFLPEQVVPF